MNISTITQNILSSKAPAATILVRLIVGGVFFTEGIQKFLFPEALGEGRFEKIGIPAPYITASFVGVVEILFGALLLLGLLTRVATIPLIIDISTAIATTKIPLLFGGGPEPNPQGAQFGLWGMLHSGRVDFSMLLGLIFLLIVGGGGWSLDALLLARKTEQSEPAVATLSEPTEPTSVRSQYTH
ncbi:MAG: DoxX family protein [Rubrobacter sp.]|nr:DoxX family protein [Rubrobacter sp.]